MRRHHHLLGLLRRAAASTSAASHRATPLLHLHPIQQRNGAAAPRFFSTRARAAAGASKSLVEDEAELSDWISDLKTDSFHLGLSSGDEGEASARRPAASRGGRGGRDSRAPPPRSRFNGGEFGGDRRGSERRGRVVSSGPGDDDEEDEVGFGSARGRIGRGGVSAGMSRRGGRGRDFNDDAGFRSPRGQRGRGQRASGVPRRGGRFSDLDDEEVGFGSPRGRRGCGGRMSNSSHRGGRESDLDDDEDDDDAIEFRASSGRHNCGRRGGKMGRLGPQRGGRARDADFGDQKSRGGKMFDFGLSEDDGELGEVEDDDGPSGFEDDLFGDESGAKKSVSFKSVEGEPVEQESVVGARDTGGGDSYLSQTR